MFGQPKTRLLSPEKFAKEIGIGVHCVRQWAKEGVIRCIRIGKHIKILESELVDFPTREAQSNTTR
jgi:excisionase family DNA binding protein